MEEDHEDKNTNQCLEIGGNNMLAAMSVVLRNEEVSIHIFSFGVACLVLTISSFSVEGSTRNREKFEVC